MKSKTGQLVKGIGSVKLAVLILSAIAVASLVGTLLPQEKANQTIYGAWWFLALLGALGINLIACTLSRFRLRLSKVGSIMTHVSVLLILSGALIDGIWGERGMMILNKGHSSDTFGAPGEKGRLPFKIRLKDFVVERHSSLAVTVLRGGHHGKTMSFVAKEAKQQVVTGTKYALNVDKISDNVTRSSRLVPASKKHGQTGIRFTYGTKDSQTESFLLEGNKERYKSADGLLRVVLKVFPDGANRDKELAKVRRATGNGHVEISGRHGSKPVKLEVRPDNKCKLGDGTVVEIKKYIPHFIVGENGARNASDKPVNPAVQIEISPPGGASPQKTWLFSKFPDFHKTHGKKTGLSIKYLRPASLDAANNLFLYGVCGGDLKFAMVPEKGRSVRGNAISGGQIPLGTGGNMFNLKEILDNAGIATDVTIAKPGKGTTGVQMQLLAEGKPVGNQMWLFDGDRHPTPLGDTGLSALVKGHPGQIKDFKSWLEVIEDGKVVKEKTIEVNHPLTHEGYAFYQASYDKERERWSGIEVVKDPGVPLVYMGFLFLVLGLVGIFYVQPVLKSSGKTKE